MKDLILLSISTQHDIFMKSFLYIAAAAALLTSCNTLFGKYERDTAHTEAFVKQLYRDTAKADDALATADTSSFGNLPWREVFTDAQLQKLIATALERNTDIRKADLTIKQAEIGLRLNKLAYLPQIAFSPSGTVSKVFMDGMTTNESYAFPVQASWQIDAFGKLYNAKKQGELSVMQAKAARQAIQTAIVAGVANLYFSLQMLDEQLATTEATLKLWHKNIEAMEAMKEAGYTNSAAIASAKAQVLQIEATVPTLTNNIRQVENSLCVLLHEAPHSIQLSAFSAEDFPTAFSAGLPLSLLTSRPDVAIAEAKLANAFYGIQSARGSFFPQLTISGQGSFTDALGAMVVNPGKFIASGIASLTQPLFAQGKLKGALEVAKLQQESAQLDFEKTLLTAGHEVSNALSKYHTASLATDIAKMRLTKLQKANDDTEFLFRNGNTTTYLETLTAQMNLLNGRLSLINNRFEKVQAAIKLYQALGGGRM